MSTKEKKTYLPDQDKEESQNKAAVRCEANKKKTGVVIDRAHTIAMILNFARRLGSVWQQRLAAVNKHSKELGRPVSESTVRGMKKAYYLVVW